MAEKETIDLLIEGGKASPGPTTVPKLSAYKLNVGEVFKQINEKTKEYAGMKVPVKLIIDKDTKEYEITVGTPTVASLIKKELGIEKAKVAEEEKPAGGEEGGEESAEEKKKTEKVAEQTIIGNLTMDQVVKIAKLKSGDLLAKDLKGAVKQVIGSANSLTGVQVEGKRPKEVIKEVDEGTWDNLLK